MVPSYSFYLCIFDTVRYYKFLHRADDLKLFLRIDSSEDAMRVRDNLDRIYNWSATNMLCFNVAECCAVRFPRKKDYTFPLFYT